MPDAHRNFAYSTVATAPSPDDSGTSLVVAAGDGALFPAVPFNATVWPTASQPLATNAEIVRVTAIATDTFTITRAQESSTARHVAVGDQIAATVTAKTLTDAEASRAVLCPPGGRFVAPGLVAGTTGWTKDEAHAVPFLFTQAPSFDRVAITTTVVGGASSVTRLGVYADNGNGYPGALIADWGTVDTVTSTGAKLITISWSPAPGLYWLAAVPQVATGPSGRVNASGTASGIGLASSTQATLDSGCIIGYTATITGALPDPWSATMSEKYSTIRIMLRTV